MQLDAAALGGELNNDGESAPAGEDKNAGRRGIFDCDDAYRTPAGDDYRRLFETGMIVVDTNVLINLYRSNGRTRRDTFAVLRQLQNQIWVPHQVLSEFWRNRDLPSVKGHHHAKARTACTALDKSFRSLNDAVERWLKDVHLDADDAARQRIGRYKEGIQNSLDKMKLFIEEQAKEDALGGTESTRTDPVLLQLEPLLLGRIGDPLSSEEYLEAVAEGKRRAEKEIPPGYADYGEKPDGQAAGDYIVWKQVIDEAARTSRDVLLVTGDIKEDWWTPRTNQSPARPRSELEKELRNRAGVALFMLTPSQLLAEASAAFKMQVDERSVNDLASREGGAEIFPASLRSAIVAGIESAHERAQAAHEVSGLNTSSPYGVTMIQAVREELNERIAAIGGSHILVEGREYPVFDGLLLLSFRTSRAAHPTSALRSPRIRAVRELIEPSEEFPSFGDAAHKDLTPVIITYASKHDSGVQVIRAGMGRFAGGGNFEFHLQSRLL